MAATEPEPTLQVDILSLHPTQLAVGFQQVDEKAARIAGKKPKKQAKYFLEHPVPVIKGPNQEYYIVDHHHLCCAALKIGVTRVYITVLQDWCDKAESEFWSQMYDARYVWLHDSGGSPITLEQFPKLLPTDVTGLKDDPYRSIAAIVRKSGGYNKDWTPFSEFHWANFLRHHVPLEDGSTITQEAIDKAVSLSKVPHAAHLPGFIK